MQLSSSPVAAAVGCIVACSWWGDACVADTLKEAQAERKSGMEISALVYTGIALTFPKFCVPRTLQSQVSTIQSLVRTADVFQFSQILCNSYTVC